MKSFEIGDHVKTDDKREGKIVGLGFEDEHIAIISPEGGEAFSHPIRGLAHVRHYFLDWSDEEVLALWNARPKRVTEDWILGFARKLLGGR